MKKVTSIIRSIFESIINIIVVILFFPSIIFCSRYKNIGGSGNLFIFGNGPSLLSDISSKPNIERSFDNILCANYFILSEEFLKYKPKYYIFVDPVYFKKTSVKQINENFDEMVKIILEKLSWKMKVIVPWNYRFSKFVKFLRSQDNISLHYLKNVPLWGGIPLINLFLLRIGFGTPPLQNVLVGSIFWGINSGFKQIKLLGVDHSWLHNLKVGLDNKVYMKNKHFYGKTEYLPHESSFGAPIALSGELFAFLYSLKGYHLLEKYSKSRSCKILNLTKNSLIDAFQKVNS